MSLWACGQNNNAQLGAALREGEKDSLFPIKCSSEAFLSPVVQVACGDAHVLACDELGNCYAWGRTREGQACYISPSPQASPRLLQELAHESVVHVACGSCSCFAITAAGHVYSWGAVYTLDAAAHEALSGYGRSLGGSELSEKHSRIIQSSMEAYLGGESTEDADEGAHDDAAEPGGASFVTRRLLQSTPTQLSLPPGAKPIAISAGFGFVIVALQGGGVLASGLNDRFQCGVVDWNTRGVPTPLPGLSTIEVVALACGQQHTVAIDSDGACHSWGLGSFGQLGHVRRQSFVPNP